MRLVQHKKEAYWFYRFLSVFYDKLVNPLFWTRWMRDQSLVLGKLDEPGIRVIDVGSGTGFTTEGIVQYVHPTRVTCVDQSPHQQQHAKAKAELEGCTFIVGDAENIPAETDSFDRYVSAGSIEYWPNPQKGINESYRVIKPGGIALMIGPLEPKTGFMKLMANTWMLFPKDREYFDWYEHAGFTDIKYKYIRPHWYPQGEGDGYALAIAGTKPASGLSPNPAPIIEEETEEEMTVDRYLLMVTRVIIGSTAGFIFIPAALLGYLVNSFNKQDVPPGYEEKLNEYQIMVLLILLAAVLWILHIFFN